MPAYSLDLRERIVAFFDEGHTIKDTVETFKVSVSCLRSLLRLRDRSGGLAARPPGGGHPSILRPEDLVTLRRLVEEQPDAYLRELADRLAEAGGPRVQPSAICKRLKELGLTRKKKISMQPSKTPTRFRSSAKPSVKRSRPSIQASSSSSMRLV